MHRSQKIEDALKVLVLAENTRNYLIKHDPKALEQALEALKPTYDLVLPCGCPHTAADCWNYRKNGGI